MTKAEMLSYCDDRIAECQALIDEGNIDAPKAYKDRDGYNVLRAVVEAAIADPEPEPAPGA